MSISPLNLGIHPNDGQGDDLRTAFEKTKNNFDYLDSVKIETGENLGTLQPNTHGVYAGKEGVKLKFKSIKQGDNVLITSDDDDNVITIRPKDSINAVEEDLNPKLGGNLNTDGYDIYSLDSPLNIYVENDDLTLVANNGTVLITGEVVTDSSVSAEAFLGPLIGNVLGNITGNVIGNVTGQVSNINNHSLSDLSDVLSTMPLADQVLTWNGTAWIPQTITSSITGVSKIIAGTNVTISPNNGVGEVTINATGGGSITELNTFDFGNFTNTFTNPITYLLNQVGLDFGSFATPSQFTVDLGSF
jgi:hypothetical protein